MIAPQVDGAVRDDAAEWDALMAEWDAAYEGDRDTACAELRDLIESSIAPEDVCGARVARAWGEVLMRDGLTANDAARLFRALAGGQLMVALHFAHRQGGGPAVVAVEHLIVDGLHLPMPAFDYGHEDPPGSRMTAVEAAASAGTGLGDIPQLDTCPGRMWKAMRVRVCAARRRARSALALARLHAAYWAALDAALAALRLRTGQARRQRYTSGARAGPPAAAYVKQPRLTRGPDACPSLTSPHVEGRAEPHAPRGSAVAA